MRTSGRAEAGKVKAKSALPKGKDVLAAAPKATAAPMASGALEAYFRSLSRRSILTREGEVELARRLEDGERDIVRALVAAPAGLAALASIGEDLRAGRVRARDVLRDADEEELADDASSAHLAEVLARVGAFAARGEAAEGRAARTARSRHEAALASELCALRIHRRVLDRVSAAVREASSHEPRARAVSASLAAALARTDRAKTELVESNVRLVVKFAKRFHERGGLQLLDLIQEGNIGLMRAVDKFDYRRGHRFSTYAAWWIKQQMSRALADQGKVIRVPVHMTESQQKVARARRAFASLHGREPTEAELSSASGLVPKKIRAVSDLAPEPLSLHAPSGAEGEGELGDFVSDRATVPPDEQIALERMRERIRALVHTLAPREQEVLRMRFGLDGTPERTLQEIGTSFSLSRERVRQIEAEALRKLHAPSKRESLDSYLAA